MDLFGVLSILLNPDLILPVVVGVIKETAISSCIAAVCYLLY